MKEIIIFIAVCILILFIKNYGYTILKKFNKRKHKPLPQPHEENIIEEIDITTAVLEQNLPYRKKYLLTKNEWSFYKTLKPISDELGLTVLSKIRVADLVEPIPTRNQSEWQKYFNKINRKHIDFVLAKPENLQIVLLIELDDNSHDVKQVERDKFIDELYKQTGYKFIRVRGTGELKDKIIKELNI